MFNQVINDTNYSCGSFLFCTFYQVCDHINYTDLYVRLLDNVLVIQMLDQDG